MTAFLHTNILVRHLSGDSPDIAAWATRYLAAVDQLLLPDLILAEVAYVLESFYEAPRSQVAATLRAVLAFPAIRVLDADLLQRAVETARSRCSMEVGTWWHAPAPDSRSSGATTAAAG